MLSNKPKSIEKISIFCLRKRGQHYYTFIGCKLCYPYIHTLADLPICICYKIQCAVAVWFVKYNQCYHRVQTNVYLFTIFCCGYYVFQLSVLCVCDMIVSKRAVGFFYLFFVLYSHIFIFIAPSYSLSVIFHVDGDASETA